jgi:DNA-binding ferritin-like protein
MHNLAAIFRFLQLFAHAAHNLTNGCTFFADHKFLQKLYAEYEDAFDATVERLIGIGEIKTANERIEIDCKATSILEKADAENLDCAEEWFEVLQDMEIELCKAIEKLAKSSKISQGTLNLIAQFADDSEVRQYRIGQRLKEMPKSDEKDEPERAY